MSTVTVQKLSNDKWGFAYTPPGIMVPMKSDSSKMRPLQIRERNHSTRKSAEASLRKHINKYENGGNFSKETLSEYFADWFPLFCQNNTQGKPLAEYTKSGYESIWRVHLEPAFGYIQCSDLTVKHVRQFIANKLASGLSKQTVKSHYRVLSLVVESIVDDGYLPRNIVKSVRCPQPDIETKEQFDKKCFNLEEQSMIINRANKEFNADPDDYFIASARIMTYIGMYCGLRLSEILALKWSDLVTIETPKGEVTLLKVARTLDKYSKFKDPKSSAGIRDIPLSKDMVEVFNRHKVWQNELRLQSKCWEDNDMIVPYHDGVVNKAKRMTKYVTRLIRSAGVEHGTCHSLRHAFATNAMHNVNNHKLIQTVVGHSSISTTMNKYGHVLMENAFDEIDNLFATMPSNSK